jgi:ubiquinone/menaquinone biosynthesis C-methylase UbiE
MIMLVSSILHAANNPIELAPDSFLGFKDLSPWLKLPTSRHALDYGSGNGQSTFFLSKYGFNVQGVDIDSDLVKLAQTKYPNLSFQYIEKNNLPFVDDYFDLVLSNFVLSEQKSKRDMVEYLMEAERVLTPEGILIALTYRSNIYKKNHNWGEFQITSNNIHHGEPVHLKIHDKNVTSYYWQEKDYLDAIQQAKLNVCAVHYPKGSVRDGFHWKDERNESPIAVLLIARQCNIVAQSAQNLAYSRPQQ